MKIRKLFNNSFSLSHLKIYKIFKLKVLIGIGLLLVSHNSFSQTKADSLYHIWENVKLPDSTRANAYNKYIYKVYLNNYLDSAYIKTEELYNFTLEKKLPIQQANALKTFGMINFLSENSLEAINFYQKSLAIFEKLNHRKGIAAISIEMGRLHKSNWNFDEAIEHYTNGLIIAKQINDDEVEAISLTNIGNVYLAKFNLDKALEYYNKSLKINLKLNDFEQAAITKTNIAYYHLRKKEFDTAIKIFKENLAVFKEIPNKNATASTLSALGLCYNFQGDYENAIKANKKAIESWEELDNKRKIQEANLELYKAYKKLSNYNVALKHYEKANEMDGQLERIKVRKKLDWIEFEKQKKTDSLLNVQKQLELKSEIQRSNSHKRTILIGLSGVIIAVLLVAYIIYKNIKRKQLQAEQEKEIELQKKEKLLKDIELATIDAMIEGQEKERQTIANDLHDDLGAVMTTLKLNINALKEKNSPELLETTNKLIDSAYNKIRGVAHIKNSGVIGKKGLLVAIQNMAEKITKTNQLDIHVIDHGLEDRLENSLELTLFRIIQELITNIIKHAQASEVNIHLTNHKNSLNIMVEDNGIGFNVKQVKTGIGIKNIEKRINHLNGTLTIDSETNKGTTIIIDVPL